MIRWLLSCGILAGHVLPLVAADKFPSRPKEPESQAAAAQPVSGNSLRERVLVLHDGTVQQGLIEQSATGYALIKPQGKLIFGPEQVRLVTDDLATAYGELSKICLDQAADRINLARWCLTNNLYDEARKEARRALALDPQSIVARNMLQRLDEKLLEATRELPQVQVGVDGSYSMLGGAKGLSTIEPLGGLPRPAAHEFTSKIQPLLVNRCATGGCHGIGSKYEFQLHRIRAGQRSLRSHAEHNLAAVLDRIDRERPLSSPLLVKLRGEPQANGLRTTHGGLTPEQTQTIRRWIMSLATTSSLEATPLPTPAEDTTPATVQAIKPFVVRETTTETVTETDSSDPDIPEQSEPPVGGTAPK